MVKKWKFSGRLIREDYSLDISQNIAFEKKHRQLKETKNSICF